MRLKRSVPTQVPAAHTQLGASIHMRGPTQSTVSTEGSWHRKDRLARAAGEGNQPLVFSLQRMGNHWSRLLVQPAKNKGWDEHGEDRRGPVHLNHFQTLQNKQKNTNNPHRYTYTLYFCWFSSSFIRWLITPSFNYSFNFNIQASRDN